MPRNSQGLYTLPLPPVRPGELVESAWANTTLDDLASAMTGSLPRDGSAPMTGRLLLSTTTPVQPKEAASKAYVDNFLAYATGMPVGAVMSFGGSSTPAGWLRCNGQAVSRTTYSALFAVIGTTYGSGNGSTTFNVPDFRDYFPRGRADSRTVGSKQDDGFEAHTHILSDPGHIHSLTMGAHTHAITDTGHAHNLSMGSHSHTATQPAHNHTASQAAHSHTVTTNSHSHGITDPGHAHILGNQIYPGGSTFQGGSGYQATDAMSGSTGTGISINSTGNIGGTTDSKTPTVTTQNATPTITVGSTTPTGTATNTTTGISNQNATPTGTVGNHTTGIGIGTTGTTETRPKNIALDFYIKAVNDTAQVGALTGITSSNEDCISVDLTTPSVPELVIHTNVSFGLCQLDANNFVPLANLPYENTSFLGFFSASGGQNPSEAFPTTDFNTGDEFLISEAGTILLYDPVTLTSGMTAVSAGWAIIYVENSSNPPGWYYQIPAGTTAAINVAYVPAAGIAANNVQDALTEVGNEKFDKTGGAITGATSITASSGNALRVTNTGVGNSLLIEDSASTDSTPLIVDASGHLAVGNPASVFGGLIEAYGSGSSAFMAVERYSVDASGPLLALTKTRGATPDAKTIVVSGDQLGGVVFQGSDGTANLNAARIAAHADGVPGTNNMPGRLVFSTTPPGGAALTEQMRLDSAGRLVIGSSQAASVNKVRIVESNTQCIEIASNDTDATAKTGRISSSHFTNAEEPASIISGASTASANTVTVGGGSSLQNAATKIGFNTAANNTTTVGTERLAIDSTGLVALQNASGLQIARTAVTAPAASDGNIYSGTYTPAVVNGTNVAASTVQACQYMRVGNVVTVSGAFSMQPTAANTLTELTLSLPVPSNLAVASNLAGTGVGGSQNHAIRMFGATTNDLAQVSGFPPSTVSVTYNFTFTYQVI
jgi:microcystin-dependent protein